MKKPGQSPDLAASKYVRHKEYPEVFEHNNRANHSKLKRNSKCESSIVLKPPMFNC